MPILTLEGIVENGQIRLRDQVTLPEQTKVYVVIPEFDKFRVVDGKLKEINPYYDPSVLNEAVKQL